MRFIRWTGNSSGASKKPSPEIFVQTLEKLQITPDQALFIGDSLGRNIEPAQKIGMFTAYAAYGIAMVRKILHARLIIF